MMIPLTTYEKNNYFTIAMCDYKGNCFDNEDALGQRFTIVLVEKGVGIATINDNMISYIAPCIFCLNEQEHIVIPVSNDSSVRAVLFHPCIINSSFDFENIRDHNSADPLTILQDKELVDCILNRDEGFTGKFNIGPILEKKLVVLYDGINKMITEQNMPNWPCRSRSYTMEILFLLEQLYVLDNTFEETYFGVIEEDFYPILLYINNNYDKKLTVKDITEQFFISKATLAKMFQANMGESFVSYLNKLRIKMSSTFLRDTLLPINEVMQRVGFTDSVHYLRTFKKYTGMSPTTYREKHCWM